MNALEKLKKLREQDRSMGRWMMALGLAVIAIAVFFLAKDFTRGWLVQGFLVACALIGAATVVVGWLPRKQADEFQREAISEYMREQLNEKKTNVPQ